jgi:hypothetical protein
MAIASRSERPKVTHVNDLDSALEAYWAASSHREDQAAYHEILLFGGVDGYPSHGRFRTSVIRWLRRLALWIEKE